MGLTRQEGVLDAPAGAARREEEPVHEDAVAVVVGVVGQQAVPLVLLLARAVPGAAQGPAGAAHLLVHRLLEVLRVDHRAHLTVVVGGPERGRHLRPGLARVDSASNFIIKTISSKNNECRTDLLVSVFPSAPGNPACLLSLPWPEVTDPSFP